MHSMADMAVLKVHLSAEIEAPLDGLARTTFLSRSRLAADKRVRAPAFGRSGCKTWTILNGNWKS